MENQKRSFIGRAWSWYRAAFSASPLFVSIGTMGILFVLIVGVLRLIAGL